MVVSSPVVILKLHKCARKFVIAYSISNLQSRVTLSFKFLVRSLWSNKWTTPSPPRPPSRPRLQHGMNVQSGPSQFHITFFKLGGVGDLSYCFVSLQHSHPNEIVLMDGCT